MTPERPFRDEDALVLTSGGQDSTTCLFWALRNFRKTFGISFFYNQKHAVELEAAERICRKLDVPFKSVDISFIKDIVISNLFKGTGDVNEPHSLLKDVPSSYVPYRNLLFLTVASGWAGTLKIRNIVTGVCQTDYSGYADCRDVFIKSAQSTLNLATDFSGGGIRIHTPLMWLSKAEEFRLAEDLDCLDFILEETVTCYNGDMDRKDFGRGCGQCPSCQLRKNGFEEYKRLIEPD